VEVRVCEDALFYLPHACQQGGGQEGASRPAEVENLMEQQKCISDVNTVSQQCNNRSASGPAEVEDLVQQKGCNNSAPTV
jgi:hypothetical protein